MTRSYDQWTTTDGFQRQNSLHSSICLQRLKPQASSLDPRSRFDSPTAMKLATTTLCILAALAINASLSSAFEQQAPTTHLHLRANLKRVSRVARRAELQVEDVVTRVPRDIDGVTGEEGVEAELDATRHSETWLRTTDDDAELDSTHWPDDG